MTSRGEQQIGDGLQSGRVASTFEPIQALAGTGRQLAPQVLMVQEHRFLHERHDLAYVDVVHTLLT
jgi:hypothetical protein